MLHRKAKQDLLRDLVLIITGAIIAFALVRTGFIDETIKLIGNGAVASFIAGIFFTSVFTIAPSSVALARIAETFSIGQVAIWAALGAVCGDLILFYLIKDYFMEDIKTLLRPSLRKHILSSFHFGFLKWLSPIIGAVIIASPLPDELGLAMMGVSKTTMLVLIPISFTMNALSVLALAWFAHVI